MIDFLLIYKQTVEFIYRVYVRQVFDQWKYSFLFFSECRPGFYKWLLGNTPCYPCPANSYTNAPKSVECNCADGYFRNPRDSKNSSCTRKYNASNFLLLKRWFLTFSNLVRPPPPHTTHTYPCFIYNILWVYTYMQYLKLYRVWFSAKGSPLGNIKENVVWVIFFSWVNRL